MGATAVVPHQFVRSLIDELIVYCSCQAEGCCWTGRHDARRGHEEICAAFRVRSLEEAAQVRANELEELRQTLVLRDAGLQERAVELAAIRKELDLCNRRTGELQARADVSEKEVEGMRVELLQLRTLQ